MNGAKTCQGRRNLAGDRPRAALRKPCGLSADVVWPCVGDELEFAPDAGSFPRGPALGGFSSGAPEPARASLLAPGRSRRSSVVDSDGQRQQQLRPGAYPCSFPGESGNDELRCLQVLLVERSSPVWAESFRIASEGDVADCSHCSYL